MKKADKKLYKVIVSRKGKLDEVGILATNVEQAIRKVKYQATRSKSTIDFIEEVVKESDIKIN